MQSRRSTLEERVHPTQTFAIYLLLLNASTMLLAGLAPNSPDRLQVLTAGLISIGFSVAALMSRSWILLLLAGLAAGGGAALAIRTGIEWNDSNRYFAIVFWLLLAGLVLQLLLTAVIRRSPVGILSLVLMTVVSLAIAEVVYRRLAPPLDPRLTMPAEGETPTTGGNGLEWVNGGFIRHPVLEFTRAANARIIAYYPSDPRNYFKLVREPDWVGAIDPRTFSFETIAPCESSSIELPASPSDPIMVHARATSPDPPINGIGLFRDGIEIKQGLDYLLTIRAHANTSVLVNVVIHKEYDYGTQVMPPVVVEIGPDRNTLFWNIHADKDIDRAVLRLSLGHENADLEIEQVSLRVTPSVDPLLRDRHAVNFQMNSMGFRDREHSKNKPAGMYRIAFLGDSMTEGWGVHPEDLMTTRLEKLLTNNPRFPGNYEILNFAVSGYGTQQERIQYREIVSAFDPNLVVVNVCFNDDMSALAENDYFRKARESRDLVPLEIFQRLNLSDNTRTYDYDIVGRELKQLADDCRSNGATLAVAILRQNDNPIWEELNQRIAEHLAPDDAIVIDAGNVLAVDDPDGELFAHEVDRHPSPKAHALVAEYLLEEFAKAGLLKPSRN